MRELDALFNLSCAQLNWLIVPVFAKMWEVKLKCVIFLLASRLSWASCLDFEKVFSSIMNVSIAEEMPFKSEI